MSDTTLAIVLAALFVLTFVGVAVALSAKNGPEPRRRRKGRRAADGGYVAGGTYVGGEWHSDSGSSCSSSSCSSSSCSSSSCSSSSCGGGGGCGSSS